jgi:hypothetical protein
MPHILQSGSHDIQNRSDISVGMKRPFSHVESEMKMQYPNRLVSHGVVSQEFFENNDSAGPLQDPHEVVLP